jgi:hypothetical protein
MGLPIALRDEHHTPVSRSLGSRVGQGFPFRSAATFSSSKDSLCFGFRLWFLEVAPSHVGPARQAVWVGRLPYRTGPGRRPSGPRRTAGPFSHDASNCSS